MLEIDFLSVGCQPPKGPAFIPATCTKSGDKVDHILTVSNSLGRLSLEGCADCHVLATLLLGGGVFVTIFTSEQIRLCNEVF